ncbi:MAG: phosphonate ABC transporter ATP-binding protein [Pseudomonadota bacterium]
MSKTAIHVAGVTKSFRRGNPVLKSVDLQVSSGELVGLIGASGSGKSTLIRLISGLERTDKNAGSIELFGKRVQEDGTRTKEQRKLRRDVGVIFQQFNLVGRLSLLSNVLAGRLGRVAGWRGTLGLFQRFDKVLALSSLERVGMVDFAHQRASQLSGGQQQRGAIARVLTQQAKIILADEPIASLDPASAERVMEILAKINEQDGTTVIVSLHQIDHAMKHCHRIVALKDGEIVFDGPTGAITEDDLTDLYGIEMDGAKVASKESEQADERPAHAARVSIDDALNTKAAGAAA